MKIGDKIYCIKNRIDLSNNIIYNTQNKIYKICEIYDHDNVIIITSNDNRYGVTYQIKYDINAYVFEEYFITEKQLRKLKLLKLKQLQKIS